MPKLNMKDETSDVAECKHEVIAAIFYSRFHAVKIRAMDPASKDCMFRILQFLYQQQFKGAAHKLECESGCFFNLNYFSELILDGNWKEVEMYLSYFTKTSDSELSKQIYKNISLLKYFEAMEENDLDKAHKILVEELNYLTSNEMLCIRVIDDANKDNFRTCKEHNNYKIQAARVKLVNYIKDAFPRNPIFRDKLSFPEFGNSGIQSLISQSLKWQHSRCPVPAPQPKFFSLYTDHRCISGHPDIRVSSIAPNMDAGLASVAPQRWTTHSDVSSPAQKSIGAITNPSAFTAPVKINSSNNGQGASQVQRATKDFPRFVVRTFNPGSSVVSMDFNPVHSTILLVGTVVGDIALHKVDSEKMILQRFELWDNKSLSPELLSAMNEEASVSVCRVRWNQDGTLFGVAYSKHIMQLFSYFGIDKVVRHKEINAHIGSVDDLAFANIRLITCGSDEKIKVWNMAANFQLICTIGGLKSPIYSLCPFVCDDTLFFISHSLDGELKVMPYDQPSASSTYFIPSWQCTTKSYSADSKRLFTSGTYEHGEPYIVEWQLRKGKRKIKRSFRGLHVCSGNLHFDMNKNRILAAGNNHQIKFWDMDNGSLLDISHADGNLPDAPLVNFNKDGNLLAVTAENNVISILAARDGIELLQT